MGSFLDRGEAFVFEKSLIGGPGFLQQQNTEQMTLSYMGRLARFTGKLQQQDAAAIIISACQSFGTKAAIGLAWDLHMYVCMYVRWLISRKTQPLHHVPLFLFLFLLSFFFFLSRANHKTTMQEPVPAIAILEV